MTPFFDSTERRDALIAAAEKWKGTPFAGNQAICQGGVDCIRLADAVLSEAGFPHSQPWPKYHVQQGLNIRDKRLIEHFENAPEFVRVDYPEKRLYAGDVVLFGIYSDAPYHTGIITHAPQMLHCMRALKVVYGQIDDPVFNRVFHSAWRPVNV